MTSCGEYVMTSPVCLPVPASFATIPDGDSRETASCRHVNQQQQLADSLEPPSGMVTRNAGCVSSRVLL